jgi:hypothetical protein
VTAVYDNSSGNAANPFSPPRRVRYGMGSTDEMLGCHLQVIADTPGDYEILRRRWPRGL